MASAPALWAAQQLCRFVRHLKVCSHIITVLLLQVLKQFTSGGVAGGSKTQPISLAMAFVGENCDLDLIEG